MSDDLVVVLRDSRMKAEIVAGVLRSDGIEVMVSTDDAAGAAPHIGFAQGTRLLVRAEDAERARELIANVGQGS